ncbi:MAG: hypothetical protein IIB46_08210, partial [Nitrospinae bacterium]|nr:hypothetical protein [Nitrospinota bacterium]
VIFDNVRTAKNHEGIIVVVNRGGEIKVVDGEGLDIQRYPVPPGCHLYPADGEKLRKGQILFEWDPYNVSIMAEASGTVHPQGPTRRTPARRHASGVLGPVRRQKPAL